MYKRNLSELLSRDGVSKANVEIILRWADKYHPLPIKGSINRVSFDSMIEKDPNRLISYIKDGNEFDGNSFNKATHFFIALLKNTDSSCVSYGIFYVS